MQFEPSTCNLHFNGANLTRSRTSTCCYSCTCAQRKYGHVNERWYKTARDLTFDKHRDQVTEVSMAVSESAESSFKMPEIANVEEIVKILTEVERAEKVKMDLIAKMKAVARLDEQILRVSLNLCRQEPPSQLTYTCRAWKNKCR